MSAAASAAPVRTRRWRRSLGQQLLGWAGLAVALGGWQLLAVVLDKTVFPSFSQSVVAVGELLTGPELTEDILPSVGRALAGFAISAVIGIVVGLVLGYVRQLGDYCSAVLDFLRSVPSPLLVPLALVVMGLGARMVIAVIVTAAVWPVLLNAFDAARRIEPLYLDTARISGLRGAGLFRTVLLPATLPAIFAGLRVALSVSLAVLVVAEILGASSGIGYFIQNAQQTFAVPQTYAGVLVLGCLGWLFDTVFLVVERRLLRWERALSGGTRA
jgi:sulfonate transport system permease protein